MILYRRKLTISPNEKHKVEKENSVTHQIISIATVRHKQNKVIVNKDYKSDYKSVKLSYLNIKRKMLQMKVFFKGTFKPPSIHDHW